MRLWQAMFGWQLVLAVERSLLRHINPDVVEVADVIEGSEANSSFAEGLVGRSHDGRFQIVEIDRDFSAVSIADDPSTVPAVCPRSSRGRLCRDLFASFVVHDKDLIGVVVSLLAEVHVIEMRVILIPKEQAQRLMVVGRDRRLKANVHNKA